MQIHAKLYTIQYYYRHILGDMEIAFNVLLDTCEFDHKLSLVKENPYTGQLVYDERQAEASLIFNICAIAEVGNNKSNLIGVSCVAVKFVWRFFYLGTHLCDFLSSARLLLLRDLFRKTFCNRT